MSAGTGVTVASPRAQVSIGSDEALNHAFRVAKALALSGFFKDAKQPAQAMAKIIAGSELGIGASAAMQQIHVIEGKLSYGATLIAALIQRSGKYRFRQIEATDEICTLEFLFRDDDGSWVSNGNVSFSIKEAERAGLLGKSNWRGYPQDMLFARALARGARRFCAEVFGGTAAYTPDELGAETTSRGDMEISDEVIDESAVEEIIAEVDASSDEVDDDEVVVDPEPVQQEIVVDEPDEVVVQDDVRVFKVTGSKGTPYEVWVHPDGHWECGCAGSRNRGDCRHAKGLRRRNPGGTGFVWPGDDGYDHAPPLDAPIPEKVEPVEAVSDVVGQLLAYGVECGLDEQQAMEVIMGMGPLDGAQKAALARGALSQKARDLGVWNG